MKSSLICWVWLLILTQLLSASAPGQYLEKPVLIIHIRKTGK